MSVRDTLLDLSNVKNVAVDYDEGVAYVLPDGAFDSKAAGVALAAGGKYSVQAK